MATDVTKVVPDSLIPLEKKNKKNHELVLSIDRFRYDHPINCVLTISTLRGTGE